MTSVSGHLQLLAEEVQEPRVKERLSVIERHIGRAIATIQEFLDAARFPTPNHHLIQMNVLVHEVLALASAGICRQPGIQMETAVEAIRDGAFDYISKPFNLSEVRLTVHRACERRHLLQDNRRFQQALQEKYRVENMVGTSPKMVEVYRTVARVASTRSTILLIGESGTGKELIARATHYNNLRGKAPFNRFLKVYSYADLFSDGVHPLRMPNSVVQRPDMQPIGSCVACPLSIERAPGSHDFLTVGRG